MFEVIKSELLYLDLSSDKQLLDPSFFSGGSDKSVAMSMIKKGGKKNCTALAEFTTSRVASDRGFGRAFVWYYEVTYDPYFQSPELDWSNIKQTYCQCMLLFCDRILYCMCPLFSFAVFFLHGGLRCNGISDAIDNFIFTYLENMKKANMSGRLTSIIISNIKVEEVATCYTYLSN